MNEIIRDFENNNISQESIDRGERIYKKLLEHQQSAKSKGFDDKWETEQGSEEELLENHSIFENNTIATEEVYNEGAGIPGFYAPFESTDLWQIIFWRQR